MIGLRATAAALRQVGAVGARLGLRGLGGVLLAVICGACASLVAIDRGAVNHPAMDLSAPLTPAPASLLSGLDSLERKGSSTCAVCAH